MFALAVMVGCLSCRLVCSACYELSSSKLTGASGVVRYDGDSSEDKCVWTLPLGNYTNYVVVLNLQNISMSHRPYANQHTCTGHLTLPGVGSDCVYKKPWCRIYASSVAFCSIDEIVAAHPACPKQVLHGKKGEIGTINMSAIKANVMDTTYSNQFALNYNIIDCLSPRIIANTMGHTIMAETATMMTEMSSQNDVTTIYSDKQPLQKTVPCNCSWILGVVVVLAFILLVLIVAIFLLIRRQRQRGLIMSNRGPDENQVMESLGGKIGPQPGGPDEEEYQHLNVSKPATVGGEKCDNYDHLQSNQQQQANPTRPPFNEATRDLGASDDGEYGNASLFQEAGEPTSGADKILSGGKTKDHPESGSASIQEPAGSQPAIYSSVKRH